MSLKVSELRIVENNSNIFDANIGYVIPLYQRAYAWEDKQLIQLIEDIDDVPDDSLYYIGSLIVSNQNDYFEVVDGQQRLTSLFILLNCLGLNVKKTLSFACRDKSNYTLNNINCLVRDAAGSFDYDRVEQSISNGVQILSDELKRKGIDKNQLIDKLSRVVLYRIEVPENTDLNRYFEIMNTRGEQLEQHDIVKAKLMSKLPPDEKTIFAEIWDACSDMTGYVQMHFASKKNQIRNGLFGDRWDELPSDKWSDYRSIFKNDKKDNRIGHTITEVIKPNFKIEDDEGYLEDDSRVRFESIIEFSYFLIHTLKVFVKTNNVVHENTNVPIVAELIDDKKLIDYFDVVVKYEIIAGKRIKDNIANFSQNFALCLLRTRYLFDRFIVKREYTNDSIDGEWSLKSLHASGQQTKKKPYYSNTDFLSKGTRSSTKEKATKDNIMIQSALRVSFTSPKVMHWITRMLQWLSEESNCRHIRNDKLCEYVYVAENVAKESVKENFFDKCLEGEYKMGVNTPHIVFNYLDYLLWKSNPNKYDDFVFEFRTSVEHWYPRNPSEGSFDRWPDGVDRFGNLCIIQRNINSRFSNMSPEGKKSTFEKYVKEGSIKLRIMGELTEKYNNVSASQRWKDSICRIHEENMISMLWQNCKLGQ